MAKLIPDSVPIDAPDSEKRIFNYLRSDPGTEAWTVFHSIGLSQRGVKKPYGEIDFVIVVPTQGVICLEIKGGGVNCKNGQWSTTDRNQVTHKLKKSPFIQVREGMSALREAVNANAGRNFHQCFFCTAVIFSDVESPPITPEFEKDEVIDVNELGKQISAVIESKIKSQRKRLGWIKNPSLTEPSDIKVLTKYLRPDFELKTLRPTRIRRDKEDLITLTREQIQFLEGCIDNPRCLVKGAAGTGKTLMAIEALKIKSREGLKTGFFCFNKVLGGWLQRETTNLSLENIHVGSLYENMVQLIRNSSFFSEYSSERKRAAEEKPLKIELDIEKNELLSDKPQNKIINTGEERSGLKLHVFSRPSPLENASADQRIVTFTLINTKETERAKPKDQDCYFQCGFSVRGTDQQKPFLEYPENHFRESLTPEEEEMALLYRHRKVFAVGHGCSADWSAGDGEEKSEKIETKILPEYEVHPVLPSELNDLNLDMWFLGKEDREHVLKECSTLAQKYKDWITDTREDIKKSVPDKFKEPALRHMDRCEDCQERIIKGIEILSENDDAWAAFQYMNQAMLMQYCHYNLSTDPEKIRKWMDRDTPESKYVAPNYAETDRGWRPFQLAFILMSLRSIVEEGSPDRDIVDLIWFPTGGGKTEAYLGLAAFTIFYRRITDNENAGTTAIMRYTLRLLTTQQFQRAASLICSMEKLRRNAPNKELGPHPITIGLWVGSGVTPNQEKYAIQDLNELLRRRGKNKFLLASCPWCGCQMGPVDISANQTIVKGYLKLRNPDRIRHVCEDPDCEFNDKTLHDGLPLQIVDEHIYSQPPTLVIGTVDKFAMMPWVPDARRLFALDNNQNYDPPWLIIQDEMHLISGPLGSMVGLYETLIDALCENKKTGARPKIVASTATISNATDQIEKLFARKQSMLFPPQGLKAGDSFFAEERADIAGRKYAGIFATGLPSQMTAMVRVLSSLVQAPLTGGFTAEEIDPYWTNMIYFNSVRELGHACTLVRSDIPEYLNVISNIRLNLPRGDSRRRYIKQDKELTSRISSDQVTEILNELFKTHHKDENAIDICLATNMIQVGLDVSRLSLMVIAGQPKTTSEYIQASSRVGRGRDYPGLVFTALNPGKPRDRSHYEHFRSYHQSFYKYVEPTSVTPFSVPVRDRALHALVITLVRYWGTDQNRKYPDHPIDDELKNKINTLIAERVEKVDPDELATTIRQVDEIWQRWETLHAPKYGIIFGDSNDDELMLPSSHNQFEDSKRRPFPTPTSMRNVDSSCEADVITEYGGT